MSNFCTNCGAPIPDGKSSCDSCGKAVADTAAVTAAAEAPAPAQPVPAPVQPAPEHTKPKKETHKADVPDESGQKPPRKSKYAVMSTFSYVIHIIAMSIPVLGLVLTAVWAFSVTGPVNRRNLARAMLIFILVGLIVGIIAFIMIWPSLSHIINISLSD